MSTVKIKMKDISPELSKKEINELNKASKRKSGSETSLDLIKEYKRVYKKQETKETVSMRISPDTLSLAKKYGKGYTSFLSRLLDLAIHDKDMVKKCL